MKKLLVWAEWLLRRAAIRMAVTVAVVAIGYIILPKIVLAVARTEAKKAGYGLWADKAELRPWEVRLHGVKVSGERVDMTAKTMSVKFDGLLRAGDVTVDGADVTMKEAKRGPGEGGHRKITLSNSTVRMDKPGLHVTAAVRKAILDRDGRVWADVDVIARTGRLTVDARGLRTDGMKPGESLDFRAKSVDVKVGSTEGIPKEGKAETSVPVTLHADRLTVQADGISAEAHGVQANVSVIDGYKEYLAEAESVAVGDSSAEWATVRVRRNAGSPEETEVELSAESVETENHKLSKGEFSIRKLGAKAVVVSSEGTLSIADARVRVGDAKMTLSGSVNTQGFSLRAEMPEVGCQNLLESLPQGLVPRLMPPDGGRTRMSGTMSWHAEMTVDLPARKKPDVSIWLRNKCVVDAVPDELDVQRLRKPFRHDEYSADGEKITETVGPGTANWTPLGSISPLMPVSVMAMEDPSFMSHRGVLIQAIENSMKQNISAGKFVRGGSTISMQLAKNLWLAREKTISRKIQEAVLTTYLEQKMTKTQIIELYLNIVEFGPDLYGVGPAARHYFAKDPGSLSLSQSLFLASLLPNPKSTGFEEGKKVSQGRLDLLRKVMKMMLDRGTIGPTQYEQGLRETPVFGEPSSSGETETVRSPGGIDPSEWR
jgi:Transglycosylase